MHTYVVMESTTPNILMMYDTNTIHYFMKLRKAVIKLSEPTIAISR